MFVSSYGKKFDVGPPQPFKQRVSPFEEEILQ